MKLLLVLLFAAQAAFGASINFVWLASTGNPTGYKLYQSTNGGATFTPVLTNTTTSATVSNLTLGVTYQHYVTAFNQDAESGPSNVTTNRIPFTAPSPPSNLSTTVTSASRIDLNWQDMADNEDGFGIERAIGSGGPFIRIGTSPANTSSFIDNTLQKRTRYCYRLFAFNSVGNSAYAGPACDRTDRR
jgi:fibronectin type 3 domain-containing protein